MGTFNSRFYLVRPPDYGDDPRTCYFSTPESDICKQRSIWDIYWLIVILFVVLCILGGVFINLNVIVTWISSKMRGIKSNFSTRNG